MNKGNDRRGAIKKLRSLSHSTKQEIWQFRKIIEEKFSCSILPNHVECIETKYSNILCDVLSPVVFSSNRIMLYIHGGSFIGGSKKAWRSFCSTLAAATSCRVIVPEYRLSPDHAFPAALEDIQSVYRTMLAEEKAMIVRDKKNAESDTLPEIIIAADGSGASQALALLFSLQEQQRANIKQVILFSPWLNFSPNSEIIKNKKMRDEILTGENLRRSAEFYTNSGNLENPLVSPVFVQPETLKNFPPVFIQIGSREILLKDAKTFKTMLKEAGCDCELDIWNDMMFMFQMADEFLAESHLAIERIGRLITVKQSSIDRETLTRTPVLEYGMNGES